MGRRREVELNVLDSMHRFMETISLYFGCLHACLSCGEATNEINTQKHRSDPPTFQSLSNWGCLVDVGCLVQFCVCVIVLTRAEIITARCPLYATIYIPPNRLVELASCLNKSGAKRKHILLNWAARRTSGCVCKWNVLRVE
jgi:hypothetical protein